MKNGRSEPIRAVRDVIGKLELRDEFSAGGVGATVRTVAGNVHTGICIDFGFCG